MISFLLALVLVPQSQNAEAKKLLDALAPPLKDPPYSQIEWTSGPRTAVGSFDRQKGWRIDTKNGDSEMVWLWDGKLLLNYMKKSNRFFRTPKESPLMLIAEGGGLAEIHYSGNADRLLKEAKQATVKKEQLEGVDCSHVVIVPKETQPTVETELHFWIDADKTCKRFVRKVKAQGKTSEQAFVYKVVDAPTITEETFAFKVPADARDIMRSDK